MGEAKRKTAEPAAMADVALSANQREQMAALISNLNTARIVAEQFITYFAREQGVNLQLYQFDSNRLVFVPAWAADNQPPQAMQEPELEPVLNGHAEL
jgi:hypothetical protein